MPLAVGDRVRIRLNGSCHVDLHSTVVQTSPTAKSMYKREVGELRGHRAEAEGKLGRIIKITQGSDHPYAVLYIDKLGREDPIKTAVRNGQLQIMGGDYAAAELGVP